MLKKKTLRVLLIFLLFLSTAQLYAAAQFRYRGYFRQYLLYGPQYINPGITDWRRERWIGQSFSTESPPAGWGGAYVSLQTYWGDPNSSFYLQMPFLVKSAVVSRGRSDLKFLRGSYAFKLEGSQLAFTMSSYRIDSNQQWAFQDMGDPLGALKLPNTSSPVSTIKLAGNLFDWDLTAYHLADNRCAFLPRTEYIPDAVFETLKISKEQMRFFDEVPTYQMFRGTKDTRLGTLGVLWGLKRAENINPRATDTGTGQTNPRTYIGYIKNNIGVDYTGYVPLLDGKVTVAAVKSGGDWYYYGNPGQGAEHLGNVQGSALKLELSDVWINWLQLESSYVIVEPTFQWIAVRDSRYAHVYGYLTPEQPNYNQVAWRAVRDEDFLLRDPRQKDRYLSDVSTYLGLRSWETSLKYPGKISIFPANFSLGLKNLTNLSGGKYYYDPETGEEVVKDHKEVKASLELEGSSSKLILSGLERDYKADKDYLQELSASHVKDINERFQLNTNYRLTKRFRSEDAQKEGAGWKFDTTLSGTLKSNATYSVGIDYRSGLYDYGLFEETEDHVFGSPYTYWELNQYFENSSTINLAGLPIRTTLAAELVKRNSTISELNGLSFISLLRGNARLTRNLTATVTIINSTGKRATPQFDKFPSGLVNNVMDYLLSYNLAGSNSNTISLRFTRRLFDEGYKNNIYATLTSRVGGNTLTFTFGRIPVGNPTYYIVGTKYDVRDSAPKEIAQRPWAQWGLQGVRCDETYPFMMLRWTMNF